MVYDDPLSQKSLTDNPKWPPRRWLEENYMGCSPASIEEELIRKNFNFEAWLDYKMNVPNDSRPRPHHHPDVEYPLTNEELKALNEERTLCNPILCPKKWKEYAQQFDEVEQRFWWLGLLENWVRFGYPQPPDVLWNSNKYVLKVFTSLIFNPFIKWWGIPPDDFWVKLSYIIEQENHRFLQRAFVLYFQSQGKIFPAPDLYSRKNDSDPGSLYLNKEFWK